MKAKYVLTYSENTDAGDPTASVKTRFFSAKAAALEAMNTDVQRSDNILHFTEMAKDDEHFISRTEMSCYVVNGYDTMRWEVNEVNVEDDPLSDTPVLETPLTWCEALAIQEKNGSICRCVQAPLPAVLYHSHLDGLNHYFANSIVGNAADYITSLDYTVVDADNGIITFIVNLTIDAKAIMSAGTKERYKELLDMLIEQKVQEAGMDVRETIEELLTLGFTPEELKTEFCFDPDDVEICVEENSIV